MGHELYRVIVAAATFVCCCYIVNFAANPNADRPSTIFDPPKPMLIEATPTPEASVTPKPDEEVCVCGNPVPESTGRPDRH